MKNMMKITMSFSVQTHQEPLEPHNPRAIILKAPTPSFSTFIPKQAKNVTEFSFPEHFYTPFFNFPEMALMSFKPK